MAPPEPTGGLLLSRVDSFLPTLPVGAERAASP